MSDWRTYRYLSGRLGRTSISGFFQLPLTLDAADPQIPNLPLLTPSGGTIASGAALSEGATNNALVGASIAQSAAQSEAGTAAAFVGQAVAGNIIVAGAAFSAADTALQFEGGSVASGAVASEGASALTFSGSAVTEQTANLGARTRLLKKKMQEEEDEEQELLALVKELAPAVFAAMNHRRFNGARR